MLHSHFWRVHTLTLQLMFQRFYKGYGRKFGDKAVPSCMCDHNQAGIAELTPQTNGAVLTQLIHDASLVCVRTQWCWTSSVCYTWITIYERIYFQVLVNSWLIGQACYGWLLEEADIKLRRKLLIWPLKWVVFSKYSSTKVYVFENNQINISETSS